MNGLKRAARLLYKIYKRTLTRITRATAPLWHTRPVTDLGPPIKALRAEIATSGSSSTTAEWSGHCTDLASYILHDNPRRFLQWPVILDTMNVRGPDYIEAEFYHLRAHGWRNWKHVLQESAVGGNDPYWLYPWTSPNSVHHCYHLARFMEATAVDIGSFARVFEYGGGYGNLCRVTRASGFQKEYVITDLPQFIALQRFYLCGVGVTATWLPFSDCSSWLGKTDLSNTLFIATWSFSESPLASRDVVTPFVPMFGALLIAFQQKYANIDNAAYFDALKDRIQATHQCSIVEITHLPGHFYLFARKR